MEIFLKLTNPEKTRWNIGKPKDDPYKFEQLLFLRGIRDSIVKSSLVHASYHCQENFGEVKPFPIRRTSQYCLDASVDYGCCSLTGQNFYYESNSFMDSSCSQICRPSQGKEWIFC